MFLMIPHYMKGRDFTSSIAAAAADSADFFPVLSARFKGGHLGSRFSKLMVKEFSIFKKLQTIL